MKLIEKLEKLEKATRRLKVIIEKFPDTEIVRASLSEAEYYCSAKLMTLSSNIEFLVPKHKNNAMHKICVYEDISFEDEVLRIYGLPFEIKLFTMFEDKMVCHDYIQELTNASAKNATIRQAHVYVVNYIQDNKCDLQRDKLPKNIANLLAFI